MKIGLNIVVVAPEALVEVAMAAETLGYESVWSGEHIALASDGEAEIARRYGGTSLYRPDSVFVEPLVMLSHLAAATTRLRLGVGIFLLSIRDPVVVARAIATLDVLSRGRLDLGIGLGWNEREFKNVGGDFRHRGQRTDEMIDALDELFIKPAPEFHGRFLDFGPIGFEPKPVQQPRPPFHIGGNSPSAFERAVRRGDGWYGGGSPESLARIVPDLRRRHRETGRTRHFEVSASSLGAPPDRAEIDQLAAAGVDRIVLTPFGDGRSTPFPGTVGAEQAVSDIERYAKRVSLHS